MYPNIVWSWIWLENKSTNTVEFFLTLWLLDILRPLQWKKSFNLYFGPDSDFSIILENPETSLIYFHPYLLSCLHHASAAFSPSFLPFRKHWFSTFFVPVTLLDTIGYTKVDEINTDLARKIIIYLRKQAGSHERVETILEQYTFRSRNISERWSFWLMISDLFRVSQCLSDLSLLHRPPLFQIKN